MPEIIICNQCCVDGCYKKHAKGVGMCSEHQKQYEKGVRLTINYGTVVQKKIVKNTEQQVQPDIARRSVSGKEKIMRIKLLADWYRPEYKTCGAAGADLKARGDYNIAPGERMKIPLGVCFEIPAGYEIQIRPRSGLSAKGIDGVFGTIDSDYRGEVCAIIINNSKKIFAIRDGDRIAQMVYAPVINAEFEIADDISFTKRGDHGFGSTGV